MDWEVDCDHFITWPHESAKDLGKHIYTQTHTHTHTHIYIYTNIHPLVGIDHGQIYIVCALLCKHCVILYYLSRFSSVVCAC